MTEETYFLIYSSNGDNYVLQRSKEELLKELHPDKYGTIELAASDILESIPNSDMSYWKYKILIIKGEIVVPKAKEVVTRFEL